MDFTKLMKMVGKRWYLLLAAAWLFTIAFIFNTYFGEKNALGDFQARLTEYVRAGEREFAELAADNNVMASTSSSDAFGTKLSNRFFLFSYQSQTDSLIFWNTDVIIPNDDILKSKDSVGFTLLSNGFYVWMKHVTKNANKIVALLPVKWNYPVTNDYLRNSYLINAEHGKRFDIFPGKFRSGNVATASGQPLFYVVETFDGTIVSKSATVIWLNVAGLLLIIIFLFGIADAFIAGGLNKANVLIALVFGVALVRSFTYLFPGFLHLSQNELFGAEIYGSKVVYRSLGDLAVNTILLLSLIFFIRNKILPVNQSIILPQWKRWAWLVISSLLIVGSFLVFTYTIRTLVSHSEISFDVLNFFSLNWYSFIGFIIICGVCMAFFFMVQMIVRYTRLLSGNPFPFLYILVATLYLLMLSLGVQKMAGSLHIWFLLWLLLFLFIKNIRLFDLLIDRVVSSSFIFWAIYFSISTMFLLEFQNNDKEIQNRQRYAEMLAIKSNLNNEKILQSLITDLNPWFLRNNFPRLQSEEESKQLLDSLQSGIFSSGGSLSVTNLYVFDSLERPFFLNSDFTFSKLNSIYKTQSKPTTVPGLYYYDEAYDLYSYIAKKSVTDTSGKILGTLFLISSPQSSREQALYPELFSRGRNADISRSSLYSYAVYDNGVIVTSHNDYPFSGVYPGYYFGSNKYLMFENNGYSELWYKGDGSKYVMVARRTTFWLQAFTLFSYLFCGFLLISAIVWLGMSMVRNKANILKMRDEVVLSLRNQIHGTFILITLLAFLIIGIVTVIAFINRYESNNREMLSMNIRNVRREIISGIKLPQQDSSLSADSIWSSAKMKEVIDWAANIHDIDINIYDTLGNLRISSLSLPFEEGIISKKIDPLAFHHMNSKDEIQFFQYEKIGKLRYLSNYIPLEASPGVVYGYLNLPYYTSESKLKQEISTFLVTIINLNAFIFLLAGIVSLFITNRIIKPIDLIGEKMKLVSIRKKNEQIDWDSHDEIGRLVKEYNKMVAELESSAEAMVTSEREEAWKQMARQVAHEIKNPLTPMRLSMQFLQNAFKNNAPNAPELADRLTKTVIEQIDHLSKIAGEFGQFASIEAVNYSEVDITASLDSVKHLFSSEEHVQFHWNIADEPMMVHGEKTHLNRLFTNLILNAKQAITDDRRPIINIKQFVDDGNVVISIQDNGSGIASEQLAKIFRPNFTTKSSGTGLGLAMCKRIVEKMGGKIDFDTKENEGTIFHVRIPLLHLS